MNPIPISRHINAPRSAVYRALLDAHAVAAWRVPDGMTGQVHELDAREGGWFRASLMYDAPTGTGKTSPNTDTGTRMALAKLARPLPLPAWRPVFKKCPRSAKLQALGPKPRGRRRFERAAGLHRRSLTNIEWMAGR